MPASPPGNIAPRGKAPGLEPLEFTGPDTRHFVNMGNYMKFCTPVHVEALVVAFKKEYLLFATRQPTNLDLFLTFILAIVLKYRNRR